MVKSKFFIIFALTYAIASNMLALIFLIFTSMIGKTYQTYKTFLMTTLHPLTTALLLVVSTLSSQAQTLQDMARPAKQRGRQFTIPRVRPSKPPVLRPTAWNYRLTDANGDSYALAQHRGKVLLIVNTASRCGYTKQYKGLEALHRQYADQGLVVLAIPCNQFGQQEPGSAEEIAQFCTAEFGVSFPVLAKAEVNGPKALAIYHFLKQRAPQTPGADIRWNFTKFLIGRDGQTVLRYESGVDPSSLTSAIELLLKQ